MSDPGKFLLTAACGDARAKAIVSQALEANRKALHTALAAWIGAHPNGADPTVHLAPEDGDPQVGRVVPRAEVLEFLLTHCNPALRHVGGVLSRLPPVPLGSIDVMVSTPSLMAIVRATPSTERAS